MCIPYSCTNLESNCYIIGFSVFFLNMELAATIRSLSGLNGKYREKLRADTFEKVRSDYLLSFFIRKLKIL